MINFTPHTEAELDELNKFTVYLNYLEALSTHLDSENYSTTDKYKAVTTSKPFLAIKSKPNHTKRGKIEKLLRSSWFTEIHLNLNADNNEFAKYSNHWAIVQVYYAIYLALRALFISMNLSISNSHSPTLKQISREIKSHPDLFACPWKIMCAGDTKKNSCTYLNLPENIIITKISPLAKNVNFYDSYALFLKTTRERKIEEKRRDWIENNKPKKQQPKEKRIAMINNISPTTIFDCLYRLRIRSNYQDVEPFLIAIQNERQAQILNYSLRNITCHLLLQLELLIAKHLGKNQYDLLIKNFNKNEELTNLSHSSKRWQLLSEIF